MVSPVVPVNDPIQDTARALNPLDEQPEAAAELAALEEEKMLHLFRVRQRFEEDKYIGRLRVASILERELVIPGCSIGHLEPLSFYTTSESVDYDSNVYFSIRRSGPIDFLPPKEVSARREVSTLDFMNSTTFTAMERLGEHMYVRAMYKMDESKEGDEDRLTLEYRNDRNFIEVVFREDGSLAEIFGGMLLGKELKFYSFYPSKKTSSEERESAGALIEEVLKQMGCDEAFDPEKDKLDIKQTFKASAENVFEDKRLTIVKKQ